MSSNSGDATTNTNSGTSGAGTDPAAGDAATGNPSTSGVKGNLKKKPEINILGSDGKTEAQQAAEAAGPKGDYIIAGRGVSQEEYMKAARANGYEPSRMPANFHPPFKYGPEGPPAGE